jgi:hypothetical protein
MPLKNSTGRINSFRGRFEFGLKYERLNLELLLAPVCAR